MVLNWTRRVGIVGWLGLAALACAAVPALAGPVSWGVKGGLVGATFRDDLPMLRYQTKLGLSVGAFAAYPASGLLAVQAEVHYVQRGASEGESQGTSPTGEDLGTIESFHVRDELEIGVLARLRPTLGRVARPYLLLGPILTTEVKEEWTVSPALEPGTPRNWLKSTGLGVSFGAGVDLPLGPGRCLLEGRYDLGLSDLARGDWAPDGQRTSSWRLLAGYEF